MVLSPSFDKVQIFRFWPKTMDYYIIVHGLILGVQKKFREKNTCTIGKGISRGNEWHKFRHRITFKVGVTII